MSAYHENINDPTAQQTLAYAKLDALDPLTKLSVMFGPKNLDYNSINVRDGMLENMRTAANIFEGSSVTVSQQLIKRFHSLTGWYFRAMPVTRAVNGLSKRQSSTLIYETSLPSSRSAFAHPQFITFSTERSEWTIRSYHKGCEWEYDALRLPGGALLYNTGLESIDSAMCLLAKVLISWEVLNAKMPMIQIKRVFAGVYTDVYNLIMAYANLTGVLHRSEDGLRTLFGTVAKNKLQGDMSPTRFAVLPFGTKFIAAYSGNKVQEAFRVGEAMATRVYREGVDAFTNFMGVDLYEQPKWPITAVGQEELTDITSRTIDFGYFYISNNDLRPFATGTCAYNVCTERDFQWLDFGGDVNWKDMKLSQMIRSDLHFHQRTGLLQVGALQQLCNWNSQFGQMNMGNVQPLTSTNGDPLLNPFIAFENKRPRICSIVGEMDSFYAPDDFFDSAGRVNKRMIEREMPCHVNEALIKLTSILDQASDMPLFDTNERPGVIQAMAFATAADYRNRRVGGGEFKQTFTPANDFGVDHIPPVSPGGYLQVQIAENVRADVVLVTEYTNGSAQYKFTSVPFGEGFNVALELINILPINGREPYQFERVKVPDSRLPPGFGTMSHAAYISYMFESQNSNGWVDYVDGNIKWGNIWREISDCYKIAYNYALYCRDGYCLEDGVVLSKALVFEESACPWSQRADSTTAANKKYNSIMAFLQSAVAHVKEPIAVHNFKNAGRALHEMTTQGFDDNPGFRGEISAAIRDFFIRNLDIPLTLPNLATAVQLEREYFRILGEDLERIVGSGGNINRNPPNGDRDSAYGTIIEMMRNLNLHPINDVVNAEDLEAFELLLRQPTTNANLKKDLLIGNGSIFKNLEKAIEVDPRHAGLGGVKTSASWLQQLLSDDRKTAFYTNMLSRDPVKVAEATALMNSLWEWVSTTEGAITSHNVRDFKTAAVEHVRKNPGRPLLILTEATLEDVKKDDRENPRVRKYEEDIRKIETDEKVHFSHSYIFTRLVLSPNSFERVKAEKIARHSMIGPAYRHAPYGAAVSINTTAHAEEARKIARAPMSKQTGGSIFGAPHLITQPAVRNNNNKRPAQERATGGKKMRADPAYADPREDVDVQSYIDDEGNVIEATDADVPTSEEIVREMAQSEWFAQRMHSFNRITNDPLLRSQLILLATCPLNSNVIDRVAAKGFVCPLAYGNFDPFVRFKFGCGMFLDDNLGTLEHTLGDVSIGFDTGSKRVTANTHVSMGAGLSRARDVYIQDAVCFQGFLGGTSGFTIKTCANAYGGMNGYQACQWDPKSPEKRLGDRFVISLGCQVDMHTVPQAIDISGSVDLQLYPGTLTPTAERQVKTLAVPAIAFLAMFTGMHNFSRGLRFPVTNYHELRKYTEMRAVNTMCFQGPMRKFNPTNGHNDRYISHGTGPLGRLREGISKVFAGGADVIEKASVAFVPAGFASSIQ